MKDNLKNTGFIILDRKLQENWLWLSEPFSKAQAWIDLLFLANHKESSFFLRGIKIDVKRGQLARGEDSLSKRWKWSRNKVRRFLKLLQTEQQIKQHTSNKINIIEVINYNLYQERNNKKDNKKTTDETGNDTHTNNDNNDNNDNKKGFTPPTLEEVKNYCQERSNNVDANKFLNFYESKGWMIGKSKMKDWKASVRTWEKPKDQEASKFSQYQHVKPTKTDHNKEILRQFINETGGNDE